MDFTNLPRLQAERITGATMMCVRYPTYPFPSGNCFSVLVATDRFRIVNFNLENLREAVKRGVTWPIQIVDLGEGRAMIHDSRIPDDWYAKEFCTVCTPVYMMPIDQQAKRDRHVLQGRIKDHPSGSSTYYSMPELTLPENPTHETRPQ